MEPLTVLNNLRIASPCPASWAAMSGDDRVRFCDSCAKNVYNLSDLTAAEATALIREAEGSLCVRLYRRVDGTVLTADCPVGLRHAVRRRLLRLATVGVVIVATVRAGVWFYTSVEGLRELPPVPTGPGVTLADWTDWAAVALGIKKPSMGAQFTAGAPCISTPTLAGAPGSSIQTEADSSESSGDGS